MECHAAARWPGRVLSQRRGGGIQFRAARSGRRQPWLEILGRGPEFRSKNLLSSGSKKAVQHAAWPGLGGSYTGGINTHASLADLLPSSGRRCSRSNHHWRLFAGRANGSEHSAIRADAGSESDASCSDAAKLFPIRRARGGHAGTWCACHTAECYAGNRAGHHAEWHHRFGCHFSRARFAAYRHTVREQ